MQSVSEGMTVSLREPSAFPENPDDLALPWRVLRVHSQREADVQGLLLHNDVTGYTPLSKERRRWTHRTVTVSVPLFPGYVFAKFDIRRKTELLQVVPWIYDVVGFGGFAATVSECEIQRVRMITAATPATDRIATWPQLVTGEKVRVAFGKYTGLEGVYAKPAGEDRVWVTVAILGRSVGVRVERSMVEKC